MKKLTLAIVLLITPLMVSAQGIWDSFENDDDVTSVIITSKMFKLLSKIDVETDDQEAKDFMSMVNSLNNIKIFTTDKSEKALDMSKKVTQYISSNAGLSELMRIKEGGNNVKFYAKEGKNENFVSELVMFVQDAENGDNETVVMIISGDIDLKQISKLTKDLNVPGSDAMKELENAKKNK